jgi:heme/copper-type cytochrome/quinol oxidase subunit 2
MANNTEGFLASAKTHRGNINMLVLIVAFILSIMIIDTRRKCDSKDKNRYNNDTSLSFTIALVIIIGTCLLFAYDIAVLFKFID